MPVTDPPRRRLARLVIVVALVMVPAVAAAQSLPRVEGPLTLDDAIERALASNLRLRASAAEARTMDSMRREAWAPFWPQVSANGYFADQRMAPNVYTSAGNTMARNYQVFNADQTRDANVTAMYPLFSGGRDYYAYRAAARRAEAGREMVKGTEIDVAMQARLDYVAAVREAENARVTADLLTDVEERLRVARQTFEAGRIPRYYVLRDEAEHANTVQMHAMATSRAEQALLALKSTLGVDLTSPITLATRLEHRPSDLAAEDIERALARHPEVRAAVRQREAAEADVRAAYGNYFPQLSVSYMYDWAVMRDRRWESQEERMRMGADSQEGYSVGLVLTIPVFDGLMRENQVRTAKAKVERAAQQERLVRQQIEKDTRQAALMFEAAQRAVDASRKGLEQAEEESRVVRERFEAGRGIQLEVLDAQVTVTRARFNAVNALADYESARAMWLRGLGRVK
ncbi:MAG: TolC family protein [Candidatus Rokubacteria bacterium]|nr:TolC family protein [Candidatus Rokubacteria bacterium]